VRESGTTWIYCRRIGLQVGAPTGNMANIADPKKQWLTTVGGWKTFCSRWEKPSRLYYSAHKELSQSRSTEMHNKPRRTALTAERMENKFFLVSCVTGNAN